MKKLILITVLLLAGVSMNVQAAQVAHSGDPEDNIYVRDLMTDGPTELSLVSTINAYLLDGQIHLIFNKNVGEVTVYLLTEDGAVYSSQDFFGARGVYEILNAPGESGNYSLYFEGPRYKGIGEFTIY